MSRRRWALAAPLAAIALAACSPFGGGAPKSSGKAVVTKAVAAKTPAAAPVASSLGQVFHPTSPWNTTIPAGTALDANHRAVSTYLGGPGNNQVADLHEFGVPVWNASSSTPKYSINCLMSWGTCGLEGQPVPIPSGATPSTGSDGAMVVVDTSANKIYEFWQARRVGAAWVASWGAVSDLKGDGRNAPATGAGISRLAGVVRLDEIAKGQINHALVFSTDNACSAVKRFPATQTDGASSRPDCIPEGGRIRLDPSINVNAIPGITAAERTVARALQTYGAYAIDNGGARMAFIFEAPNGRANPYPGAGFGWDYYQMSKIPWAKVQYLAT